MRTIICHVSNGIYPVLKPSLPHDLTGTQLYQEPVICFSQNRFVTLFGEYLYLFYLDVLKENFRIKEVPTGTVLYFEKALNTNDNFEKLCFHSRKLKAEWWCFDEIDVKKYSLGVIKHWSPCIGKLELLRVGKLFHSVVVDLYNYRGELRGNLKKEAEAVKEKKAIDMHESRLEHDSGQTYLVVYYDKALDDFNEAIKSALLRHKLKVGECPVICLPKKEGQNGRYQNNT